MQESGAGAFESRAGETLAIHTAVKRLLKQRRGKNPGPRAKNQVPQPKRNTFSVQTGEQDDLTPHLLSSRPPRRTSRRLLSQERAIRPAFKASLGVKEISDFGHVFGDMATAFFGAPRPNIRRAGKRPSVWGVDSVRKLWAASQTPLLMVRSCLMLEL